MLGLTSCVDAYMPDTVDTGVNYLVVDGFIKGNGVTRIKLSRTIPVGATTAPPAEKGAQVFIVDNTGLRYALKEVLSGSYQSDSLLLNPVRRYQLRISSATGAATYQSDLVPLKVTPPIDNLKWRLDGSQVQLSLSTHDATGQSRYYHWGLVETWEFNAAFESHLEYDPQQKVIIPRVTPIYTCWRTESPTAIKQGSSAQLSQDALTDVTLLTPSAQAERFKIRYSVLVSQYAETAEEFAYYDLLRKNTEAVGTVNDPLPSQLTGNVHRVDNPNEPVLGYVGAHTVQQKRLFIGRADLALPTGWQFTTPYQGCTADSLAETVFPYDPLSVPYPRTRVFVVPENIPLDNRYSHGFIVGYIGSSKECADCRIRGSNVKPSYW
ncbi:MAG: DUF4249 domain-containing protein [Hymenobacter sp.]|nr:MAG: DUF4249 domain-containing protein [Hymenobacter sp.]